jgi:hypothetical protein
MQRAWARTMDDDALELDRRAGKAEKDDHHPLDDPMPADTSDTADDRVTEPGEDRPSEDSLPERDGFDDAGAPPQGAHTVGAATVVPEEGFEPPRLAAAGFKPAASAIPPLRLPHAPAEA